MKKFYLCYLILVAIIGCSYSETEYEQKFVKPQKYAGKVIRKELNFKGYPVVYLKQGSITKQISIIRVDGLYMELKINDSLYKPQGRLHYYLIRKDTTMVFDTIVDGGVIN